MGDKSKIAIRINSQNVSIIPFERAGEVIQWPKSGRVDSAPGSKDLYGVLLEQDILFIERAAFYLPYPTLCILEVSENDITQEHFNKYALFDEVAFTSCNVLFNGGIIDFLHAIKDYCTPEQNQIFQSSLAYKAEEITRSMVNDVSRRDYLNQIIERNKILKECSLRGEDNYSLFFQQLSQVRCVEPESLMTPLREKRHLYYLINRMSRGGQNI